MAAAGTGTAGVPWRHGNEVTTAPRQFVIQTEKFLSVVNPLLAICSSDYDDKFDHPKPEIRTLLHEAGIPLFTTKTGDVVIDRIPSDHSRFVVTNLISGSTKISSQKGLLEKKVGLLRHNEDSIRNSYRPGRRGPKKR